MASRYQEQSLPVKLMTISNAEDVRRNSNRHAPISATLSGPHSMYGGSNGEYYDHVTSLLHHSPSQPEFYANIGENFIAKTFLLLVMLIFY